MATYEEWTKIFGYLMLVYPKAAKDMSSATGKAYYSILKDLPADALAKAAEKLAGSGIWFPSAAEIRQTAFDLVDGDELPLPMECWHQIEKKWGGQYVEFHPLTQETLSRMGGFRKLSMSKEEDVAFHRAQFIKTCETLRKREIENRRQLPSVKEYKALQAGKVQDAFKNLAEKKRLGSGPTPPMDLGDYFDEDDDDNRQG